jgi:cell division protein ZapA
MSQQHLEITIADRTLKIACPVGQESALLAATAELNTRISEANTSTMITTPEQSLLMTALNLTHDLIAAQEQIRHERKAYQSKINLLKSTIERAMLENKEKQA